MTLTASNVLNVEELAWISLKKKSYIKFWALELSLARRVKHCPFISAARMARLPGKILKMY